MHTQSKSICNFNVLVILYFVCLSVNRMIKFFYACIIIYVFRHFTKHDLNKQRLKMVLRFGKRYCLVESKIYFFLTHLLLNVCIFITYFIFLKY